MGRFIQHGGKQGAGFFLAADRSGAADRHEPAATGIPPADHKHPALQWWLAQSWVRWRPLTLAGAWILVVTGLLIGYRTGRIHSAPPLKTQPPI